MDQRARQPIDPEDEVTLTPLPVAVARKIARLIDKGACECFVPAVGFTLQEAARYAREGLLDCHTDFPGGLMVRVTDAGAASVRAVVRRAAA